jgi:hypothetical protein
MKVWRVFKLIRFYQRESAGNKNRGERKEERGK